MRYTRHRAYPVEQRGTDEAGASLHGGQSGTAPILADHLDQDMHDLTGRIDGHDQRLQNLQGTVEALPRLHLQTGQGTVTFNNLDSYSLQVTFPEPFTAVPNVHPEITAAPGASARWNLRPINITRTGFSLFVFSPEPGARSSWNAVPVAWTALLLR